MERSRKLRAVPSPPIFQMSSSMTRRLCPRWRASRLSLSLSWVLSRWMDRKLCREKRRTTPRRMAMVIFRVRRIDDQRCWRAKRVEKATRKRVVLILLL
ncbi:MAG TPA: hypothetical protein VGA43_03930, partial [Deferrimonas sp.]